MHKSLHLWRKAENAPSVRPEVNDAWMKPFGASAKGVVRHDLQVSPGKPSVMLRHEQAARLRPTTAEIAYGAPVKKPKKKTKKKNKKTLVGGSELDVLAFEFEATGPISNIEIRTGTIMTPP